MAIGDLNISSGTPEGRQPPDQCPCPQWFIPAPPLIYQGVLTAAGITALLMAEGPHGWKLAVPPSEHRSSFTSVMDAAQKQERDKPQQERKVKSLGTTLEHADPRSTRADNKQCPDYGTAFSNVHQTV